MRIRAYELRVLKTIADLGNDVSYADLVAALTEQKKETGGWLRRRAPISKTRLETALANLEDPQYLYPQPTSLREELGLTRHEALQRRRFRVTDAGLAVLIANT